MRIAIATAQRALVGGVETYLRWLLAKLVADGHEVAVAYQYEQPDGSTGIDSDAPGADAFPLLSGGIQRLRAWRPDVVFSHSIPDLAADFAVASMFPCVLFAHAYYGTCATGQRRHRVPHLEMCTRRFSAACLGLNYARGCGIVHPARLLRQYSEARARSPVLSSVRGLVVASHHMREVYEAHGVSKDKVHVLPLPTLQPIREPSQNHGSGRVLFVGRLTQEKGCDHAITATALAARQLGRSLTLAVCGQGAQEHAYRHAAAKAEVEVVFHGWVDGVRKQELFAGAELLVVPSLWPEPFGMVGLEAGAAGVPTVAYETGGIRDWLTAGENGELAHRFDPADLAAAMVRALSNPAHYIRLSAGAQRIAREFSPAHHYEGLLRLLGAVAQRA